MRLSRVITGENPFVDAEVLEAFPEFDVKLPCLGAGSFKVAFRASTAKHPDSVLKLVKEPIEGEDDDAALPVRIGREVEGMKALSTSRVVSILEGPDTREIGERKHLYFLEPYFAGGTLKSYVGDPVDIDFARVVAEDLLDGIIALWERRIVHRDIKPENIALLDDRAVLLDLGIAFFVDLTPVTDAFGESPRTPRYAAPEQFELRRAASIDHRTDQFQVGIVLFELITGGHPFNPDDPASYLERLTSADVDVAALDAADVAPAVRAFLVRLLQPEPNRRYRTPELAREAAQEAFA